MGKDKVRKNRKQPVSPTQFVCTPQGIAASKNSVELGLVFSLAVLALFLYSFYESVQALPEVSSGRQLGANLNLANLETDNNNANNNVDNAKVVAHPAMPVVGVDKSSGLGNIPHGTWPVTLRDEINDYETIVHPGDEVTRMKVPKFWSRPLHNNQQFTRKQAMLVGTCVEPDPNTGSQVRGEDCPEDERTIYVAIASYRDYQCRYTVESVFKRAKNPKRVRVGEFFLSSRSSVSQSVSQSVIQKYTQKFSRTMSMCC